jgi:hypothetical protein
MSEKLFRVLITILLTLILGAQVFALITHAPSVECTAALDEAARVTKIAGAYLDGALDDYDNAAYTRAENINQQMFMANEAVLMLDHVAASVDRAALNVQVACR